MLSTLRHTVSRRKSSSSTIVQRRPVDVVRRFPDVILCRHERNSGKGRAVRTGIERATGDYLMSRMPILEYEPQDTSRGTALLSKQGDVV